MYQIAEENGVENLIAGAWGCGVFMQDPYTVATLLIGAARNYTIKGQNGKWLIIKFKGFFDSLIRVGDLLVNFCPSCGEKIVQPFIFFFVIEIESTIQILKWGGRTNLRKNFQFFPKYTLPFHMVKC